MGYLLLRLPTPRHHCTIRLFQSLAQPKEPLAGAMAPTTAFDFSGDVAIVTGAGSRMDGESSAPRQMIFGHS